VNLGRAVALGLGVMKSTDLFKQVFDRATGLGLQPYLKSAASMALAGTVASAYESGWKARLELAGAVAGIAAVAHELEQVLQTRTDSQKMVVVERAARSAAQAATRPGQRVQAL
jgi:hypothetical protein